MRLRVIPSTALLCWLTVSPLFAQQRQLWPSPVVQTNQIEEIALTGVGVLVAGLVAPGDARVRRWAIASSAPIPGMAQLDALFRPMGGHLPLVAATGTWMVGHLLHEDEIAAGGLITAESIAATLVAKGVISRILGRSRPQEEPHSAWDFGLGRGMRSRAYRSFPSGHAANAFALAAAVHEELHYLDSPASPWVSGVLYGAASVTSLSRVLADEHWLSDVVGGAVLGGLIGALVADANGR